MLDKYIVEDKYMVEDECIVEKDFISNGLRCVIIGMRLGHRCGYIAIPSDHKYYCVDYNNIDVDVHGGWTYDGGNDGYPVNSDKDVWWIGFDCGHSWDGKDYGLISQLNNTKHAQFLIELEEEFKIYESNPIRNTDYVVNELINAAKQL